MSKRESKLKLTIATFLFLFGLAILFMTCIWALEKEASQLIPKK